MIFQQAEVISLKTLLMLMLRGTSFKLAHVSLRVPFHLQAIVDFQPIILRPSLKLVLNCHAAGCAIPLNLTVRIASHAGFLQSSKPLVQQCLGKRVPRLEAHHLQNGGP